jgi:hypothetical protein
VIVTNTDLWILERIEAIFGCGYIRPKGRDAPHLKPCFEWTTANIEDAQSVVRHILPYLSPRRTIEAESVLAHVRRGHGPRKRELGDTCVRGHVLTIETVRDMPNGKRRCKPCDAERQKAYRARKT